MLGARLTADGITVVNDCFVGGETAPRGLLGVSLAPPFLPCQNRELFSPNGT